MLCRKLTIQPKMLSPFGGIVVTFPVFRDSPKYLYVPRFCDLALQKQNISNVLPVGAPLPPNVVFAADKHLRPYQQTVIDSFMQVGDDNSKNGLLQVGCGRGKTTMACHIIAQLRVRTLVVVNKEMLALQWKERIAEYLPAARVGMIQGDVADIADKDIVLVMLQTASSRPADYFYKLIGDQFGFVIFDEVHRACSPEFSKALIALPALHTLGLSATMERKDELSIVAKWFLGPIRYSELQQDLQQPVRVRAVHFKLPTKALASAEEQRTDPPSYATLLTRLSSNDDRIQFLCQLIYGLIKEEDEELKEVKVGTKRKAEAETTESPTAETKTAEPKQIIVLAQHIYLLRILHKNINQYYARARPDVVSALYIGGMEACEWEYASKQKIVLATFAIAAEALDIKTLTTLVLATPKSDIRQAVGRILRTEGGSPLVVDIVDSHPVFCSQWRKRITYYEKCKYEVREEKDEKSGSKKKLRGGINK